MIAGFSHGCVNKREEPERRKLYDWGGHHHHQAAQQAPLLCGLLFGESVNDFLNVFRRCSQRRRRASSLLPTFRLKESKYALDNFWFNSARG